MTQLSTIVGTHTSEKNKYQGGSAVVRPTDAVRVNDSPLKDARKSYFNPFVHTEGEFRLKLLAERILIVEAAYGDPKGIYKAQKDLIWNAVKDNLHRANTNYSKQIPNELKGVVNEIIRAKRLTKGAAQVKRIRGKIGGFDPFGNDPLISVDVICDHLQQQINLLQLQLLNADGNVASVIQNQINSLQNELVNCKADSGLINLLNDKLEESGHDFMYGYLTPTDRQNISASDLDSKASHQRIAIEKLALLIGQSRTNMFTWIENGIMRQNVQKGAEPLEGRLTAFGVGYRYQKQAGIIQGIGLDPATIAFIAKAVLAIIGALTAAISAATALVNALNNEQQNTLTNNIPPPGSFEFNPSTADWQFASPNALGNSSLDDGENPTNEIGFLEGVQNYISDKPFQSALIGFGAYKLFTSSSKKKKKR